MIFRKAQGTDIPRIMQIIKQAQAQMKAAGSMQWQNGYPADTDIRRDIAQDWGYVFESEIRVIAYGAVVFDGEAAYDQLQGKWLTDAPYLVVHRVAVADEAKHRGIATQFMQHSERIAQQRGVRSFRIDTNFDNKYMLNLLRNLGFTYCGTVQYASGERLAFEKQLNANLDQ